MRKTFRGTKGKANKQGMIRKRYFLVFVAIFLSGCAGLKNTSPKAMSVEKEGNTMSDFVSKGAKLIEE